MTPQRLLSPASKSSCGIERSMRGEQCLLVAVLLDPDPSMRDRAYLPRARGATRRGSALSIKQACSLRVLRCRCCSAAAIARYKWRADRVMAAARLTGASPYHRRRVLGDWEM